MNGLTASAWDAIMAVAWNRHIDETIRIAALIVAFGTIAKVVHWAYKLGKRVERVFTTVEQQLLTNNGGSTLKDKVEALMRVNGLEVPAPPANLNQQGDHQ